MQLAHYLALLLRAQTELARALREVGEAHQDEPDVATLCAQQAQRCDERADELAPFAEHYGKDAPDEPERLHSELFRGTRTGGLGLLRDLQDLYLMAAECDICWTVAGQAAQGARDRDLLAVTRRGSADAERQLAWVRTRMKQAAPQALVVG
jgi:hypothetical protein